MHKREALFSGAFSEAVLDHIPDIIRIIDKDGKVVFSNKALKKHGGKCTKLPGSEEDCEYCVALKCVENNRKYDFLSVINGKTCAVTVKPLVLNKSVYALEVFKNTESAQSTQRILPMMTKDIEVARSLQLSILRNNLPDIDGYRFYAEFLPCEALGGDMYDCFEARDGRVIMYIADVSGHGVMPAMLTVYLRQEMFTQCKKPGITPTQVLKNIQDSFEELNIEESIYITIFLIALNPVTGEYTCANAGHSVPPYIAGCGEVRELFLPGTPVCRWTGAHNRKELKGTLRKGERLLLYTDGLDGIHAGTSSDEGLKMLLIDGSIRGRELLNEIKRKYIQVKTDDVTMVLCERD